MYLILLLYYTCHSIIYSRDDKNNHVFANIRKGLSLNLMQWVWLFSLVQCEFQVIPRRIIFLVLLTSSVGTALILFEVHILYIFKYRAENFQHNPNTRLNTCKIKKLVSSLFVSLSSRGESTKHIQLYGWQYFYMISTRSGVSRIFNLGVQKLIMT